MSPERSQEKPPLPTKKSEDQPTPHDEDRVILVSRSNGEITTMKLADESQVDAKGWRLGYIVEKNDEDGKNYILGYKSISENLLSDEGQAKLADELAMSKLGTEEFNHLAAERAGQLLSMESSEIEQPIEKNEALHEEAAEDLGELAAEQVVQDPVPEIEEPVADVAEVAQKAPEQGEPSLDQILGEVKSQYDRTTDMLVTDASQEARRLIGRVESQIQEVDGDLRHFGYLREESAAINKLAASIESSTYNNDMARKSLSNTLNGLHSIYSRIRRASEQGVGEISQPALSLDTAFDQAANDIVVNDEAFKATIDQQKQQYPDQQATSDSEVSTGDFLGTIHKAKEEMGALVAAPNAIEQDLSERTLALRSQLTMLDHIAQSSHIDPAELRQVAAQFNQIVDGSENLLLGRKLQDTIDALQGMFRSE